MDKSKCSFLGYLESALNAKGMHKDAFNKRGCNSLASMLRDPEYIVACQRGGVSVKPTWLQAATGHVRKALTKRIQTINKPLKLKIRANIRPILTKAG